MSKQEFPLPVMPFMEWLLSMGQRVTKYGEGVALLCPPLTHTHQVINWTEVALQHPHTGSHTQDPAPGADLVSSCGANRGMT